MKQEKKTSAGSAFWQILFPLIVGIGLVAFLGTWVVLEVSPGNISRFAEISTILLVIPYLGLSLLGGLFLAALIVLTVKISQGLPTVTGKILKILDQIRSVVQKAAGYATAPVIRPKATLAGIRRIFTRKDPEIKID